MVSRYQTLKGLQEFNRLFALGIIQMNILDWLTIYEFFLIEKQTNGKMQSYYNTAENYRLSETHIRRIVFWMEGC